MGFLRLVSARGAGVAFASAFVARLPVSMVPIGMVVMVAQVRGSYALAGMVTAAFTVGAAAGTPLWGAWTDRWGQLRVVLPACLGSAAALVVFTLAVPSAVLAIWLVLGAAVVGLWRPPVAAAMRACWREVARGPAELHAAYCLEAVVGEVVFITGPMLISLVVLTGWAGAPLLVAAACQAGGGVVFCLTRVSRNWRYRPLDLPQQQVPSWRRGRSPVRQAGVLAVLLVSATLGVGFGVFNTALTASATAVFGRPHLVGVLFAAVAGGSAVGGLLYGARRWPGQDRRRLVVSLAGFSGGLGVLALLFTLPGPGLAVTALVLVLMGLPIAAGLVMRANLVDAHASPDRLTEAQSWLSTAHSCGSALGALWAGLLLDAHGVAAAMAAAGGAVALAMGLCLASQRVWSNEPAAREVLELADGVHPLVVDVREGPVAQRA